MWWAALSLVSATATSACKHQPLLHLAAACSTLCAIRRFRVLDEVDRMMQMGFIEDVETILKADEGRQVGTGVCV